jgi:hypothetical protein
MVIVVCAGFAATIPVGSTHTGDLPARGKLPKTRLFRHPSEKPILRPFESGSALRTEVELSRVTILPRTHMDLQRNIYP